MAKNISWLLSVLFSVMVVASHAQVNKWRDMHKVKKKETIFGIAQHYGITTAELMDANPEMKTEGYQLKKGDYIFIPHPSTPLTQEATAVKTSSEKSSGSAAKPDDVRNRAIRLGVLLPLHNENGDGRRMLEYYRGLLMACDSLKQEGISVDIKAWNTDDKTDVSKILMRETTHPFDVLVGPLYSKQVTALSAYSNAYGTKVLIPFSIEAKQQLSTTPNLYQVYQNTADFNESVISRYLEKFAGYHTVLIDCNDTTSKKGIFTFGLRKRLDTMGRDYSITNLKSSENLFAKAFSTTQPNVVILNTGRSPELNVAFAKLNNLLAGNPQLKVTLFGYTEWMMYTKYNLDNFYRYNVYIPAAFYTNPLSSKTARIEKKYRWNFHADMMQALPRFAITGFDHGYFFLKGIHQYGMKFTGAPGTMGYEAIQSPLRFERVSNEGGWQNKTLLLVHYTPEHRVEIEAK